MKVIMFQERFAPLVASGEKCRTIRPVRRNAVRPGDVVSLRAWTGKPYRSKQRVLREVIVVTVQQVCVQAVGVTLGTAVASVFMPVPHAFATADGFADWPEMLAWFETTHGLPFHGNLIRWA